LDTQDATRTGVAPFTRSGGKRREVSGVPTVPSLPARRAARFPNPSCNQPECEPPVLLPPAWLPEECPPPKCPPAEWPPPPPCCAAADASRHVAATKTRIMRVGCTRMAIRLAMAVPIPRESISSLLLIACIPGLSARFNPTTVAPPWLSPKMTRTTGPFPPAWNFRQARRFPSHW
jgi:hypothetical protein